MCSVTCHQGNAHQSHTHKDGCSTRTKTKQEKSAGEDGEKLDPRAALVRMVQPLWRMVSRVLQQLKLELPLSEQNSTCGVTPQRPESRTLKRDLHTHVHTSTIQKPKGRSSRSEHRRRSRLAKRGAHKGTSLSLTRGARPDACYNTGGS